MKKIIIFLSALVAFVSCDLRNTDTPEVCTYYFKTTEEYESLFRDLFNANDENGFYAQDDHAVIEILNQTKNYYPYEIYKDGELMVSDKGLPKGNSVPDPVYDFTMDKTYLGTKYELTTIYPDYISYPYKYCGNFEPLTTVTTANNYWKLGDGQDMNFMANRQYYATDDLNAGCGYKSYYTRIFFGGVKHDSSDFAWWRDDNFADSDVIPRPFYDDVITGLRLVINKGGTKWTPEQDIKDPETGIMWHLADIYFDGDEYYTADNRRLGADLNDGGAGDFLYLYYTKDERTGRKLMLTNPYLKKNSSIATGPDGYPAVGFMGSGLLTWTSGTWKVDADQLLEAVGNTLRDEFKPYFSGDTKRVDFIYLYDKNMRRDESDLENNCPANFNHKARGDREIFISYSYITPEDKYWNW